MAKCRYIVGVGEGSKCGLDVRNLATSTAGLRRFHVKRSSHPDGIAVDVRRHLASETSSSVEECGPVQGLISFDLDEGPCYSFRRLCGEIMLEVDFDKNLIPVSIEKHFVAIQDLQGWL